MKDKKRREFTLHTTIKHGRWFWNVLDWTGEWPKGEQKVEVTELREGEAVYDKAKIGELVESLYDIKAQVASMICVFENYKDNEIFNINDWNVMKELSQIIAEWESE